MIRKYAVLPLVLAIMLILTLISREPPKNIPETGYSLAKARQTLDAIAKTPRPIGSAGHDQARDWLMAKLSSYGLEVSTQKDIGVRQANFDARRKGAVSVSPYENIIAVLPGRDRVAKAVLVMAHYDSVAYANGASDDAAGIASVLEAARVMAAGNPPQRDVIFLLTDAEELGMIGAKEFFDWHPLAARVGVVVNAEARGSRGRAIMFQTSAGNRDIIDIWARNAVAPVGNSLANAVYQRLPNDTDLSVPLAMGIAGINAAYIDGLHDYHMPTDNIENIDPASLQHLGVFVLTTTRALSIAPKLPAATGADSAYFDLFGLMVVRYPIWGGWLLIALSVVGLAYSVVKQGIKFKTLALGTLGAAALLVVVVLSSHLLGNMLYGEGLNAFRDRVNEMDRALWMFLALGISAVLIVRPGRQLALGALVVALLLAIAVQIMLPGANWLFAWPALFAAALAIIAARYGQNSNMLLWSSAAVTVVAGSVLLITIIDLYMTVAPESAAPVALIALFLPLLAAPLFQAFPFAKTSGVALLVLAAGLAFWLCATERFSARYPLTADLFHHEGEGKGWWATASGKAQLPVGPAIKMHPAGFDAISWTAVPAAAHTPQAPVISQSVSQNRRQISISSGPAPRAMMVMVTPQQGLAQITVNGRTIALPTAKPTRIAWRPETANAELLLAFNDTPHGSVKLQFLYALAGMPSGAPPAQGVATDWAHFNGSRSFTGAEQIDW